MKKRRSIRWILFWYNLRNPRDWLSARWAKIRCRLSGHEKPYEMKVTCEICPRCNQIIRYTGDISHRIFVKRSGE